MENGGPSKRTKVPTSCQPWASKAIKGSPGGNKLPGLLRSQETEQPCLWVAMVQCISGSSTDQVARARVWEAELVPALALTLTGKLTPWPPMQNSLHRFTHRNSILPYKGTKQQYLLQRG